MKDVKIKELAILWKETIMDTSFFLAKWSVIAAKWLWKEIQRFFRGCTWITYLLIMVLGCCLVANHELRSKRNDVTKPYIEEIDSLERNIDSLNRVIDSLNVEAKTDILLLKAGQYHITPHGDETDITKDSVASLLTELGAWYPEIIMAQIQTESGYGTSDVALNSNNLLGMKKTNKRKTTQIKNQDYHGYGMYNNWESCVIDRVIWDYELFGDKIPTREEYVHTLNKLYADSRSYGTAMNEYSKAYLKYLNGSTTTDTVE